MADTRDISQRMRSDWNRRIAHDYRYWMSDGYHSDEEMWASGERDLEIVLAGIPERASKSVLEVGCGVGRILRAASKQFQHVIGVDVSEKAIEKAQEFLKDCPHTQALLGSGVDLSLIPSASQDVVFSYAAITSAPTDIIARNFVDMHRVLKAGGDLRLQCYLGREQGAGRSDTLHLRCFRKEHFEAALRAAGFSIIDIKELVLPIQVSFKEMGIEAVIVSLKRDDRVPASWEFVSELLLPGGEPEQSESMLCSDLELWMSVNYAKELVDLGDIDKAKETVEFATRHIQDSTIDVRDTLERIVSTIEKREKQGKEKRVQDAAPLSAAAQASFSAEYLEGNMRVLEERFPDLHIVLEKALEATTSSMTSSIELRSTQDGPVIFEKGLCLDHPSKPVHAGRKWAESALPQNKKNEERADLLVLGFACAYHIEALQTRTGASIHVIEPSKESFLAALRARDLRHVLSRLASLQVASASMTSSELSSPELLIRSQTQALYPQFCGMTKSAVLGERGMRELHPKISVLGPLQGGTLPMLEYTHSALHNLHQRVVQHDVSGFAMGFHHVEKFVVHDLRRTLARNRYTEMISQLLLDSYDEKPIDILICMAQAPITGALLKELRSRGVITVLWFVEDYFRFHYWQFMAQHFDYVFTIQKGDCLSSVKAAGAGHVYYLPTAADPSVHFPVILSPAEKERWGSPISFVGAGYHNRRQVFAGLAALPFKLWGTEWPLCSPFDRLLQEEGRRLTPKEYTKIFCASDINLNLHSSAERDGVDPYGDFVNPRTFELAACEAFQLVDKRLLLPELFDCEQEMATFSTVPEMKEKIQYYLAHPEERLAIAAAGRKRVLRDHSYETRMKEMLKIIYSHSYEHLQRRVDQSGWSSMLQRARSHDELFTRCEKAFQRGEEPNLDGILADIVNGDGSLSETERKLLFLYHVRKQITQARNEEVGKNLPEERE